MKQEGCSSLHNTTKIGKNVYRILHNFLRLLPNPLNSVHSKFLATLNGQIAAADGNSSGRSQIT